MRILIFHGYLLRGTGSNIYNASLAASLVAQGHEIHLFCQEPSPEDLPWVDAVVDWTEHGRQTQIVRQPVRTTVYRPNIGSILPVYVFDRYEHFEAKVFPDLTETQLSHYIDSNVRAVAEVAGEIKPDFVLANHLVMGPVIVARATAELGTPYVVKIHGSALEYTVKPYPRFLSYAREGLERAKAVLVGSRHTAESLWATITDPALTAKTLPGPPGVDISTFNCKSRAAQLDGFNRLREFVKVGAQHSRNGSTEPGSVSQEGSDSQTPHDFYRSDSFARNTEQSSLALDAIDPDHDRIVVFVGKLIASKGVDLLLAAWPLVLQQVPNARLVIVGFGSFGEGLVQLQQLIAAGDLDGAAGVAGENGQKLRLLRAFFTSLGCDERISYANAAANLPARVSWVGRLEHAELIDLLPVGEAIVVPSTFPESFGMVVAEGAACGAFPIVANHSGLAEVVGTLAPSLPEQVRPWLSFDVNERAVQAIADRVCAWLTAPEEVREATARAVSEAASTTYSWEQVAHNLIKAAT